jgi:integrase
LIQRRVLPKFGDLAAQSVTRADVREVLSGLQPGAFNSTLAAVSAIFSWAVREEIVSANPCNGIENAERNIRERVLTDDEVRLLWAAFDDEGLIVSSILKVLLLTGQRSGEVLHMRREHVKDGWWTLPGAADAATRWPGTKNKQNHRVWLPLAAQEIIADLTDDGSESGFVFAGERGGVHSRLDAVVRGLCERLKIADKVTPHDLRRTFSTAVVRLGFGIELMNRLTNHKEKNRVTATYNQHKYEAETKAAMEAVSNHFAALVEGRSNVIAAQFRK